MASSPNCEHKLTACARVLFEQCVPPKATLAVALSGGMDSVSLLDALLPLRDQWQMAACHVNHGISARADQWESFCRNLCRERGVELHIRRLSLSASHDSDITEELARRGRLQAFADIPADGVVAAHHADDQAETVLFRMLRGTGTLGMGAMRPCAPLPGASRLPMLRPWLDIPRADIVAYAKSRRLQWVEDEDNRNVVRRRNFLRHRVMPVLREYLPDSGRTLSLAASRFDSAASLLAQLADEDQQRAGGGDGMELGYFHSVGQVRLQNFLHVQLSRRGAKFSERGIAEAARQILSHRPAELALPLGDITLRVWRNRLYLDTLPPPPGFFRQELELGLSRQELPEIGGALVSRKVCGGGLSAQKISGGLVAQLRKGGERMQLGGRARPVADILRESGMTPWRRRLLPLLFSGESLAAIPGEAVSDDFIAGQEETGLEYRMEWQLAG